MGERKTLRRFDFVMSSLLPSLAIYGSKSYLHREPMAGDMVILRSAPPTEWSLSIYREGNVNGYSILESVQTGELCRWENVGFLVINKETIGFRKEADYTDEQFAFRDKFYKVYKKADFYLEIPFIDRIDGDGAHIIFRTRWGLDDIRTSLVVSNWRKITQKSLLAQLVTAQEKHKSRPRPKADGDDTQPSQRGGDA